MRFKEVTSSRLPVFGAIAQLQIKTFGWFFLHWLLVYSFILYIPFFGYFPKKWICRYFFEKKMEFWFLGSETKHFENPRQPFSRVFNLASSSVFCLRFASRFYILEAIESWPFFEPKSRDMTSPKRHFLKNNLTYLTEIFCVGVTLMLYKSP